MRNFVMFILAVITHLASFRPPYAEVSRHHALACNVVDVSVFPTSIGANPMQSIYTFAKIFADRMAGERPKP